MASKKKLNGCKTVCCVEEAAKKCGRTIEELFERASYDGKFDVDVELQKFKDFKKYGVASYPRYHLPREVIRLSEIIHRQKCPHSFFNSLPRPVVRQPEQIMPPAYAQFA